MSRLAGMFIWRRDLAHAATQFDVINFAQINGTQGDDHLHGRRTPDTINGRGGDDVLNGRYGDDTLNGDGGNDVLKGSGNEDVLNGGTGDDFLYGGTERQEQGHGGDELFGGSGDDRLYGGFESDLLTGGTGKDRFMYTELSDTTLEFSDTVLDFEQGNDKLVLRGEFRDGGGLHFIGNAEFSHVPGEVRFAVFTNQSQVLIDFDGDGTQDFRIVFPTEIQFQASDFSF